MDFETNARQTIGSKELENLCNWFKQKVLKSQCNYVVFCSKRMYSLALFLEQITGEVMDNRYLTDSAIISVCEEITNAYKSTGNFPKILLVEDIVDHGFSINTVIEDIENRLKSLLTDELEDNLISKLSESISIEIYCYAASRGKKLLRNKYLNNARLFVKYKMD